MIPTMVMMAIIFKYIKNKEALDNQDIEKLKKNIRNKLFDFDNCKREHMVPVEECLKDSETFASAQKKSVTAE